jgi:hypothetical protein
MKQKKKLANIAMIGAIVVILAAGILAVGAHQGWFDKKDTAESAVVTTVTGTADLSRDGIASPLTGETALRDGDDLATEEHASLAIQAGDTALNMGASSEMAVTHAGTDSFSVTVTSGQVFANVGETRLTLTFGSQVCIFEEPTVFDLTVRTGSETLYLLSGTMTVGGTDYSAGQALSWVDGELTADSFEASELDDEAIGWCQTVDNLCFTAEELQQVLDDRAAEQQAEIEAQVNPNESEEEAPDSSAAETAEETEQSATASAADSESGTAAAPAADTATSTTTTTATTTTETTTTAQPEPAKQATCTISIRCDTILSNMDNLDASKAGYVPSSGTILSTTTVSISDGDSVYDVLKRACSAAGIQMEASYTAAYGSYYVEGINNLYEFDCGSESGWMYKVNGWFPNYGCSSYTVSDGDSIVFCYTCNGLGADVGA